MRLSLVALLAALPTFSLSAFTPPAGVDEIYAVFTTSEGEFTAELFFREAPSTVANFIGLAEGTKATMDLTTGAVLSEPFYDGLTFHETGAAAIVTGSPDGTSTGGPGYRFPDEISPLLSHNQAGILSMENIGSNTNGSQFAILRAADLSRDVTNAIFGRVVEGLGVVNTIGGRAAGTVTIDGIEIVRQGAEATAFDEAAQILPMVYPVAPEIGYYAPNEFQLEFPRDPFAINYFFRTSSFLSWTANFRAEGYEESFLDFLAVAFTTGRRFYRMAEVENVPSADMEGLSISIFPPLQSVLPGVKIDFGSDFDAAWKSTSTVAENYGEVFDYRWYVLGNMVQLRAVFQPYFVNPQNESQGYYIYQPMQAYLFFDDEDSGTALVKLSAIPELPTQFPERTFIANFVVTVPAGG